jgi:outer membrane protein OmpA-like peptidoglycan-associated protein
MTVRRTLATLVIAGMITTSGCAWWQERNRTTKGATYGTGAGAATGAAVGAILGGGEGAWKGAAVGAAIGGLAGGGIGYYMDRQAKEMEGVLARQDRVEREGEMLRVALSSDVLFDSGKATLQPGAQDKLAQVAEVLDRYPRTALEIVGHTDSRGGEASNQSLSERRADAVASALVKNGVNAARITTRGVGESRPVSTNETPEGRMRNRRVDIITRPDDSFAAEREPREGAPPPAYEPR